MRRKITAAIRPESERAAEWLRVYDTNEVAIKSPIPHWASVPGKEEALVYLLDLDALTSEQRARLCRHLAEKFEIPIADAERILDEEGCPILAEDVLVEASLTLFDFLPYREPLGLPLRWQDDESGVVSNAIMAYFDHSIDASKPLLPEQLELVIRWGRYFIQAPCWMENAKGHGEEAISSIQRLRDGADKLETGEDVEKWIDACLEMGIDPL